MDGHLLPLHLRPQSRFRGGVGLVDLRLGSGGVAQLARPRLPFEARAFLGQRAGAEGRAGPLEGVRAAADPVEIASGQGAAELSQDRRRILEKQGDDLVYGGASSEVLPELRQNHAIQRTGPCRAAVAVRALRYNRRG